MLDPLVIRIFKMAKRGTPEDIKKQRKLLRDKEAIKLRRLQNMYERIHPRAGGSSSRIQAEAEPKKVTSPKTEPKKVKPAEKLKALPSSRAPAIVKNVRTIGDFVDSYNKLPPEKQKIIDDRLAKANKKRWDRIRAGARGESFKALPKAQQVEKIVKVAGSNKNIDNFTKAIGKVMRSVGMRALGPALLLVPDRPAGDPDELEKLRRAEKALERRKEAGDRPGAPGGKKGGGKIKKNYSKGGGVRSANY